MITDATASRAPPGRRGLRPRGPVSSRPSASCGRARQRYRHPLNIAIAIAIDTQLQISTSAADLDWAVGTIHY
ncbi:hypothetical protein GUJ93_ZPchr0009g1881 [Zizania palustris]|uniref:Uncharacterized protein n=1 Tax=Zizania palustris TaxID=103762 RepID=A0A8J5V3V2_ZIZPA|nr:hypothetical protein GUJ93_ZPchr0009g1881 [Zizania palustris]